MIPIDKFEETEKSLIIYLIDRRLDLNFHRIIKDFIFHKLNIKSLKKVGNRQPFLDLKKKINKLRLSVIISKQKMKLTDYRDLANFFKTLEEYEIFNGVHIELDIIDNIEE